MASPPEHIRRLLSGSHAPPVDPTAAATNAVLQGTENPIAQRAGGTVAAVAATPAGAVGLTVGQNLGFSAVGNAATDAPEIPGLAWVVTFLFQGIKRLPWVNQNTAKWFILPALGFVVTVVTSLLVNDGNFGLAISKAIQNCGLVAVNAVTNYKTALPMGILGPSDNP